MKKIKVAVLMGGKSPEHEISLISGREVVKNLDKKKYIITPLVISRNGKKFVNSSEDFKFLSNFDVVFIALHGPNGEDGTIQGFLELLGVPYTGSGLLSSALGMDKVYSRKLFIQSGLSVPDYVIFRPDDDIKIVLSKFKKPPIFVHPHNQGSAVGASLVKDRNRLKKALHLAHKYSDIALVDEYIAGVEITCAILGNENPRALPLVEIVPKREFFDWEAKYNERLCDEIVPARISKSLTKKAQDAAILAYLALGCRGFGRVDMIIRGKVVFVLEVNTIPGLTPVSLFPKAAKAAGISFTKLLDEIINYSLE